MKLLPRLLGLLHICLSDCIQQPVNTSGYGVMVLMAKQGRVANGALNWETEHLASCPSSTTDKLCDVGWPFLSGLIILICNRRAGFSQVCATEFLWLGIGKREREDARVEAHSMLLDNVVLKWGQFCPWGDVSMSGEAFCCDWRCCWHLVERGQDAAERPTTWIPDPYNKESSCPKCQ